MATIEKYPRENRVTWRVRWREDGGHARSKTFSSRSAATAWLERGGPALVDHVENGSVAPAALPTFDEYAKTWRKVQAHRPGTVEQIDSMFGKWVLPLLGSYRLDKITPTILAGFERQLEQHLAPATVETAGRWVRAVLRAAVADGLLERVPATGRRRTRREQRHADVVTMTAEQVLALADAVPRRYRIGVLLQAMCGLRQGELCGLTVDRIDRAAKTLRIDRQLVTPNNGPATLASPKSASSNRTVPVPPPAWTDLLEHLLAYPSADGWVISMPKGGPLRRQRWADVIRDGVEVAGLTGITSHQLRHFYASALIRHGESVVTVQRRLGHASADETLRTYAHLWPDADDRTRDAITATFACVPGTQETGPGETDRHQTTHSG